MVEVKYLNEYVKVKEEYTKLLNDLVPEKGLKNINAFKERAKWAWENIEPKLHVTFGNAKLPKSTCIINLGTWFNCPGRKEGFCEICDICYDKSPEVRFKVRTKERLEQEIYWRSVDEEEFADELIEKIIEHNNKTRKYKVKLIRWSEVGEIRNQKDLEKIRNISNYIYSLLGIKSYIYTHNDSLDFTIDRPNLTINGSGFMVDNEYRTVEDREEEYKNLNDLSNKRDCICDCTQCNYCSKKEHFTIIEELR